MKKSIHSLNDLLSSVTKIGALIVGILAVMTHSVIAQENIRLNQEGYYSDGPKVAVVASGLGNDFEVIDKRTGSSVFSGSLGAGQNWSFSGENVQLADFSSFDTPGDYQLKVGGETSYEFSIGDNIHAATAEAALKAYYFNRASTALEPTYAGPWARNMGHPDTDVLIHSSAASAQRPTGTVISSPKGWYDAGDYNKYIVNSGISTYTLLAFYEHFPEYAKGLNVNIPESNNGTPDLLDEIKWNLDWMLTMQDPNDGGVYHKLTTLNFSGRITPEQGNGTRYVVQKTTGAALNFAAVMAVAHRVYKDFDAAYAEQCLTAAVKAWDWARANPAIYYQQPSDVQTGQYEDDDVSDEFAWAANELYITTGDDGYYSAVNFLGLKTEIPWWQKVSTLGLISLSHHKDRLTSIADVSTVESKLLGLADELLAGAQSSSYRVSLVYFAWGSNSAMANEALVMMQAYRITKDKKYLNAAIGNLDYLMGKNATGYSFVTGIGDKTPIDPHHRQSSADGVAAPVPGFLVGGPHDGQQDGCNYPSSQPAKSYVDAWCSYSTNEVTINWNAPLFYLSAAVEDIMSGSPAPTMEVNVTSPEDGKLFKFGRKIRLKAEASSTSGDIVKVVFFDGKKPLKTDKKAPFVFAWTDAPLGEHVITARAVDSEGNALRSAPVTIEVLENIAPEVRISSPSEGTVFPANTDVAVTVEATDADGNLNNVALFMEGTLVARLRTAPFTYTLPQLAAGTYKLVARAVDNDRNLSKSVPVTITVSAAFRTTTENEAPTAVSIYPNPFSDAFTLQSLGEENIETIRIRDVMGKVVMELGAEDIKDRTISGKQWKAGVYLVQVMTSNGTSFHQIIKK